MPGSGADGVIVLRRMRQSAGEFINLDVIWAIGMCVRSLCTGCPFMGRTLPVLHFLFNKGKIVQNV